ARGAGSARRAAATGGPVAVLLGDRGAVGWGGAGGCGAHDDRDGSRGVRGVARGGGAAGTREPTAHGWVLHLGGRTWRYPTSTRSEICRSGTFSISQSPIRTC